MIEIRKNQAPAPIERAEFGVRFRASFIDPAFRAEDPSLARLEDIACSAYTEGRKAPFTQKAGPGYADPLYNLSTEWITTKQRIDEAQQRWADPVSRSRVLLICGSARNDGTCPGEISKTFRLLQIARETLEQVNSQVDVLDLSLLTSDYQSPSPLKLMIDRLVCADGGNPDPTSTSGKKADKAKTLEMAGWHYPQHLAGRAYGLIVHGDVAGVEDSRRALSDWLDWMGFLDAGAQARLGRYIGYYEPYATSHEALDRDAAVQKEARNVALAVAHAVVELRAGRLQAGQANLSAPRRK